MAPSNRAKTGQPALNALALVMKQVCAGAYGTRKEEWIAGDARRVVQELGDLGFVIIPQPYTKPGPRARRGNANNFDDPWIGKSHSTRLCGG
jgi:hypothetical protein